jgi:hypothetical protein
VFQFDIQKYKEQDIATACCFVLLQDLVSHIQDGSQEDIWA